MGTIYAVDKIGPDAAVRLVIGGLNKGQVVLIPTDTLFGLSCAVLRPDTLRDIERGKTPWIWRNLAEHITKIKQRKGPFLILARDWKWASTLTASPIKSAELPNDFGDRPITYIFKAKPDIVNPYAGGGKIAIRVPDSNFLYRVLRDVPLICSTSANRTGHPAPAVFEQIDKTLFDDCDMVLNAPTKGDEPSVIVDVSGDEPVVMRE